MFVNCKILLVLLNLCNSINGDRDEVLALSRDQTGDQTLAKKNPARKLISFLNVDVNKPYKSSTRYWSGRLSTKKVFYTQNKNETRTKKRETELINTLEKMKSAQNSLTTTRGKPKTSTSNKISPTLNTKVTRTKKRETKIISTRKKMRSAPNSLTITKGERKTLNKISPTPNPKITRTEIKEAEVVTTRSEVNTSQNSITTTEVNMETTTSNEVPTPNTEINTVQNQETEIITTKPKITTTPNSITTTVEKKKTTTPNTTIPSLTTKTTTTENIETATSDKTKEKPALNTTKERVLLTTQSKSTKSIDNDRSKKNTTSNKTARGTKKGIKKKPKTKKVMQKKSFDSKRANKPTTLNPYNLKNDLLKVMTHFPNAHTTAEVIGRSVEYKDIVLLKITDANSRDKKNAREGENKPEGETIVEGETKPKAENRPVDENKLGEENKIEDENKVGEESKLGEEQKLEDEKKTEAETDTHGKKIIFIVHALSTFELWKIPCLYEKRQFKLLMSFYLSHLKNFDIYLIPVANPDGFAREDNLWNKNVSPQEDCGGVALDRNFDVAWNSSSNVTSCDQQYPGPSPFSEAESEAVKDVFLKYGKRMAAYIHVHATNNNFDYKGHAVLVPKGYTDEESDEDKYIDIKGEIDEAIRNAKFNIVSVNVKTVYSWYGPVAGTSVDYASEVIKVPFAMEFLMQPYAMDMKQVKKDLNRSALKHIWKRIIDTIFTFIHDIENSNEGD